MNIQVKGLAELQSGAEVLENRKVVLSRIRAWKPKPRIVAIVEEVEQETAILIQQIAPPPVPAPEPAPNVDSVEEIKYPTFAQIVSLVCERFQVTKIDLMSHRRTQNVVLPRQVVMYLARTCTLQTLPFIGLHLGGRDHTTILSGLRKIERMRAARPEFDAMLQELIGALKR